ncbi:hypothetical protein PAMA_021060 [Pampus argenteus]
MRSPLAVGQISVQTHLCMEGNDHQMSSCMSDCRAAFRGTKLSKDVFSIHLFDTLNEDVELLCAPQTTEEEEEDCQLAVGTCEIVMLNRDSSVPRRTIARQTARCACRRGQIAGTTRARPACVDDLISTRRIKKIMNTNKSRNKTFEYSSD